MLWERGVASDGWDQTREWWIDSGNPVTSRWTDDPGAVRGGVMWCGAGAEEIVGIGKSG